METTFIPALKKPLQLYIGPCVIENETMPYEIAARLQDDLAPFGNRIKLNFKASIDKANRSSNSSFRGLGLEKGLRVLYKIKKELALPTITDFHDPAQASYIAEVVDTLQVPAFLCRQTDMILEGAMACQKRGIELFIKKGQFLSPNDVDNIIEKATTYLSKEQILIGERGTSFGYNNLIVDMASFSIMKKFGVRTIHDATHCVQMPGSLGNKTGGKREQIPILAKAAIAAGADGVFIETHPEPEKALSDASTAYPLSGIKNFVETLLKIYELEL